MKTQSNQNHRRIDPIFIISLLGSLATLTLAIIFIIQNIGEQTLLSFIVLQVSVILLVLVLLIRRYGLKVQDRLIRNEENFRSFQLTGKSLDSRLTLDQIIALRFASDEEYPTLAMRAILDNLSSNQIKGAVKNWRPDHHRV